MRIWCCICCVGGGVLLCGVAGVLCVGVVAMVLTLCGLCRQG